MVVKRKKQKKRKRDWPVHLKTRVRKLRGRMREAGLDGFVVSRREDVRYLTGFHGEDSWVLVMARQLWIVSDSRFEEELNARYGYAKMLMRRKRMTEAIGGLICDYGLGKVGYQSDNLTVMAAKGLARGLGRRLKGVSGWLMEQRAVKDKWELGLIGKAVGVAEHAFMEVLGELKAGQSEREVAALLEYRMHACGGEGVSFDTIVASGARGSLPHSVPGGWKIRKGGALLIDFGAVVGGYCSDLTRTIGVGGMPKRIREVYTIVLEAQMAGIDAVRAGVKLGDVDGAARKVITDAGLGDYFGHGVGHGIGLVVHEMPVLGRGVKGRLEVGNVVTIEPGVYLPGVGGVRIEDDVVVTRGGCRVLSRLGKGIDDIII